MGIVSAAAVAEETKAGAEIEAPIVLDPHIRASLSAYEEHRLSQAARSGTAVLLARLRLDPQDFDRRLREAMHRAEGAGELIATVPLLGKSDDPGLIFDDKNQSGHIFTTGRAVLVHGDDMGLRGSSFCA